VIVSRFMSAGPERRFTLALILALSASSVACGSESETTGASSDESPGAPTPYSETTDASPSCVPNVALGEPIAAPLPSFTCPSGWEARSKSSLLLSGRFTTARELIDAFCTRLDDSAMGSTSSNGEPAGIGIDIDFETSDVIAVAYDGEVALHRRAGELWIRHDESCERSYRTALFVVPKDAEPLEQTCSTRCR
jgi:hypothetical protein